MMLPTKIGIISSVPENPFHDINFKELNFSASEKKAALTPEIDLFLDGLSPLHDVRSGIKFELIRAIEGKLPNNGEYDAYILGGSPAMISDRYDKQRIDEFIKFIHKEVNSGTPVLGMCFGHQILASAFGGVVSDMSSRILGSHDITLNTQGKGDELVKHIANNLNGLYSHKQSVFHKSGEIDTLGYADHDPHTIIKVGNDARGVQFHPEFKPETITFLAKILQKNLASEGILLDDILLNINNVSNNTNTGQDVIRLFLKKYYT